MIERRQAAGRFQPRPHAARIARPATPMHAARLKPVHAGPSVVAWRRGMVATAPVAPMAPVAPVGAGMELSGVDELGFSLKPPKFIRKAATAVKKAVTIKNVLKVGAVVGAAALIPGALPLLAKGAVGAGKLLVKGAVGAERAIVSGAKGAVGAFIPRAMDKTNESVAPSIADPFALVDDKLTMPAPVATAPGSTQAAPTPAPVAPTYGPEASPSASPVSSGGGGGGGGPLESDAAGSPDLSPTPTQAGIAGSGAMLPLALAGVAVLLLSARKTRRRR